MRHVTNTLFGYLSTATVGTIQDVPTISRFFGISIAMYFDDHGHPHFHARHAGRGAKVRIDTLEVMDSTLGRRQLRFVLAWAELHQEELAENGNGLAQVPHCWRSSPPMNDLTPDITDASVVRHGVLALTFADGLVGEVDVLDRMRGPVFERARTQEGFVQVSVDARERDRDLAWRRRSRAGHALRARQDGIVAWQ